MFECPDQVRNVAEMLSTLDFGQRQRRVWHCFAPRGVSDDALSVPVGAQVTVEHAFGIEGDVRPVVALAEAGIADQARRRILLEQLEEALSERQRAARAAVRTATHDDVHTVQA